MWIYPVTDGAAIYRALALYNNASGDGYFIRVRGDLGGDPLSCYVVDQLVADGVANSAAPVTFNAWQHAGAVFASVTSRTIYLKGVRTAGDADDVTGLDAPDRIRIGGMAARWWDGGMAEVAIWQATLVAAEMAALAAGAHPKTIRPASLRFYAPLRFNKTWDRDIAGRGGYDLTPVNGPTWADDPPVVRKMWEDEQHRRYRGQPIREKPIYTAEIVWGHDTGVLETTVRNMQFNWTGTGTIGNPGVADTERLEIQAQQYMISEVVDTGAVDIEIDYNVYAAGGVIDLDYRHGATASACEAAGWNNYVGSFTSLGYVQVRVTSTF